MEIKTAAVNRKDVVKAIAERFGEPSVYQGPPTFAYQIGDITVNRDGIILTDDEAKAETIISTLKEKGMMEEETVEAEEATAVKVPLEGMAAESVKALIYLLHSKQYLINKAVGKEGFHVKQELIQSLEETHADTTEDMISAVTDFPDFGKGFSFAENNIIFSGFPFTEDAGKIKAYCELAAAMVSYAKEHPHINPKETIEENEKYYMRTWLVRLGFGGKEGKDTRKVLLEKLKGHTAFRTEADKEKWNERQKAKKAQSPESGVE